MKLHVWLFPVVALSFVAGCAGGEVTQCTRESRSAWQDAEAFQQNLRDQSYRINEFKITEGKCYEVYGFARHQSKVEIDFNPVDGRVVKRSEGWPRRACAHPGLGSGGADAALVAGRRRAGGHRLAA